MAYWPRKRTKRIAARIRAWIKTDKPGVPAFAGYKVGMTHILGTDTKKTSPTKGEIISIPVTILECPPLKILSIKFYKKTAYGNKTSKEILLKTTKETNRRIKLPKKAFDVKELDKINPEEYDDIAVILQTQPKVAGLDKKTPDFFEAKLTGTNKEKLELIKKHLEKDLLIEEIFKESQLLDTHAITKGKGTKGPVARMGIGLKPHKSEKGRRQPGSRGGWKGQQHVMYRTAYTGQMGHQQRLQWNQQLIKIGHKPEEINPKDGFPHYGKVKNTYILIKGSVPGVKKRLIILTQPLRPQKNIDPLPNITQVSLESKQGR